MSLPKPCFPVVDPHHPCRRKNKRSRDADRGAIDEGDNADDDSEGQVIESTNIEPTDGAAYLAQVRAEARRLPEFFTAPVAQSQQQHQQHLEPAIVSGSAFAARYLVSHDTLVRPPPTPHHAPVHGRAWVDQTLENFDLLRKYLVECRDCGVGAKVPNGPKAATRVPVPAMKDQAGWHVFCVGDDDACGNAGGYYDDAASSDKSDEDPPAWKRNIPTDGTLPTVSLLLQMDQVMVRRVLEHLTKYVSLGFAVQGRRAAWLYALLARLQCPIHRDDAVTLYTLLKKMTLVRAQLSVTDIESSSMSAARMNQHCLASLNTLIAIVGIYFEQGGGYANVMEVKSP